MAQSPSLVLFNWAPIQKTCLALCYLLWNRCKWTLPLFWKSMSPFSKSMNRPGWPSTPTWALALNWPWWCRDGKKITERNLTTLHVFPTFHVLHLWSLWAGLSTLSTHHAALPLMKVENGLCYKSCPIYPDIILWMLKCISPAPKGEEPRSATKWGSVLNGCANHSWSSKPLPTTHTHSHRRPSLPRFQAASWSYWSIHHRSDRSLRLPQGALAWTTSTYSQRWSCQARPVEDDGKVCKCIYTYATASIHAFLCIYIYTYSIWC